MAVLGAGRAARGNYELWIRQTAKLREKRARLVRDPGLNAEGRRQKLEEIDKQLRTSHEEMRVTQQGLVEAARAEFISQLPAEQERRAAFTVAKE